LTGGAVAAAAAVIAVMWRSGLRGSPPQAPKVRPPHRPGRAEPAPHRRSHRKAMAASSGSAGRSRQGCGLQTALRVLPKMRLQPQTDTQAKVAAEGAGPLRSQLIRVVVADPDPNPVRGTYFGCRDADAVAETAKTDYRCRSCRFGRLKTAQDTQTKPDYRTCNDTGSDT